MELNANSIPSPIRKSLRTTSFYAHSAQVTKAGRQRSPAPRSHPDRTERRAKAGPPRATRYAHRRASGLQRGHPAAQRAGRHIKMRHDHAIEAGVLGRQRLFQAFEGQLQIAVLAAEGKLRSGDHDFRTRRPAPSASPRRGSQRFARLRAWLRRKPQASPARVAFAHSRARRRGSSRT